MVFAAGQLQEKCKEQNRDLYITLVDMTKALDTVSREGLWQIMSKFGCPDKFIIIVVSSTMICLPACWIMGTLLRLSLSQTESSKAVYMPPHCSV